MNNVIKNMEQVYKFEVNPIVYKYTSRLSLRKYIEKFNLENKFLLIILMKNNGYMFLKMTNYKNNKSTEELLGLEELTWHNFPFDTKIGYIKKDICGLIAKMKEEVEK